MPVNIDDVIESVSDLRIQPTDAKVDSGSKSILELLKSPGSSGSEASEAATDPNVGVAAKSGDGQEPPQVRV